jgi:N-acetylglutamate synthase
MPDVAVLEDISERAWPPLERVERDGVVLRFADGFTRRANSARCDGAAGDLEGLVATVESEYRRRGLRPGFRVTPLTPPGLEPLLEERGYFVDAEAVVMVADALPTAVAPAPRDEVALAPALDEQWLRVFHAIERRWPPEQDRAARSILASGAAPRRFALARVDGAPAATGYGRLVDDWLYLACVATEPPQRRRGLARAVSEQLCAWGAGQGARRGLLQVLTGNAPAQALYAQLGFSPRYVYRDLVPG